MLDFKLWKIKDGQAWMRSYILEHYTEELLIISNNLENYIKEIREWWPDAMIYTEEEIHWLSSIRDKDTLRITMETKHRLKCKIEQVVYR